MQGSCNESYVQQEARAACDSGCAHQKRQGRQSVEMTLSSDDGSPLNPGAAFGGLWNRLTGLKDSVFSGLEWGSRAKGATFEA